MKLLSDEKKNNICLTQKGKYYKPILSESIVLWCKNFKFFLKYTWNWNKQKKNEKKKNKLTYDKIAYTNYE